jgi:hypothetical protein
MASSHTLDKSIGRFSVRVRYLVVLLLVIGIGRSAAAADMLQPRDNPLIGSWIERLKLGSMVVSFTDSTMSYSSADISGAPSPGSTHTARVHYTKSDKAITIVLDEPGGGGLLVTPEDATHILLDFPGMGAHHLERFK